MTIIANKILLKTIKISVRDCLVYIPKVIRLFFKLLLALIVKLYWQERQDKARDLTKSNSTNFRHLTFYIDSVRITTANIDRVKRAAGYI